MKLFALTGGIGCGKSAVCKELAARGVVILDVDAVAHELQEPGTEGFARISAAFPSVVAGGKIDRTRLAAFVFGTNDTCRENRRRLDRLMQPLIIRALVSRLIALWRNLPGDTFVVVDAPILLEMRQRLSRFVTLPFRGIIVVNCPESQQSARVISRSGGAMSAAEVESRLQAQMPLAEKSRQADYVVDNSGSLEDVPRVVNDLLAWMRRRSNEWSRLGLIALSACAALALGVVLLLRRRMPHE